MQDLQSVKQQIDVPVQAARAQQAADQAVLFAAEHAETYAKGALPDLLGAVHDAAHQREMRNVDWRREDIKVDQTKATAMRGALERKWPEQYQAIIGALQQNISPKIQQRGDSVFHVVRSVVSGDSHVRSAADRQEAVARMDEKKLAPASVWDWVEHKVLRKTNNPKNAYNRRAEIVKTKARLNALAGAMHSVAGSDTRLMQDIGFRIIEDRLPQDYQLLRREIRGAQDTVAQQDQTITATYHDKIKYAAGKYQRRGVRLADHPLLLSGGAAALTPAQIQLVQGLEAATIVVPQPSKDLIELIGSQECQKIAATVQQEVSAGAKRVQAHEAVLSKYGSPGRLSSNLAECLVKLKYEPDSVRYTMQAAESLADAKKRFGITPLPAPNQAAPAQATAAKQTPSPPPKNKGISLG
jgi:hypothetical protein